MINAIIFDFDGVILESADIKTMAFRELFAKRTSERIDDIVDYHMRHMGISRFVKFRYVYENILNLPYSDEEEKKLGEKFSDIVFKKVLNASFVPGALEFIQTYCNKIRLFIASGTPEDELLEILEKREIRRFFFEAYGAPREKPGIINEILHHHSYSKEEVVFVGDAESDMNAAEKTGLRFIARITDKSSERIKNSSLRIFNLGELYLIIEKINNFLECRK